MSNQPSSIHFQNFQILRSWFLQTEVLHSWCIQKTRLLLQKYILFRFLVFDFFNHNIFIFIVFKRFSSFFKFGSRIFSFFNLDFFKYNFFTFDVFKDSVNSSKISSFSDFLFLISSITISSLISSITIYSFLMSMRQVCRWSRVFNKCEIGRQIGAWLLYVCILLPITIHVIFTPMAQLKDSFFSSRTTFTFWTKLPLFPINLEGFC